MKIIKEGNQIAARSRWWVGQEVTCGSCEGVFRLDATDFVVADPDENIGEASTACPTPNCRTLLKLKKSEMIAKANEAVIQSAGAFADLWQCI